MDDLQKMDKKEITMDKINENDYILFDDEIITFFYFTLL